MNKRSVVVSAIYPGPNGEQCFADRCFDYTGPFDVKTFDLMKQTLAKDFNCLLGTIVILSVVHLES